LFARLRDLAGAGELEREIAGPATVETIWQAMAAEHPALAPYRTSVSASINAEYAGFDASVRDGDEVAFLPPVSGGSHGSGRHRRV
jgi:molybdopterin converting factor small subunit